METLQGKALYLFVPQFSKGDLGGMKDDGALPIIKRHRCCSMDIEYAGITQCHCDLVYCTYLTHKRTEFDP